MANDKKKFFWWSRRTKVERKLIVVLIVCIVIAVTVLCSLIFTRKPTVCTSPGCVRSSMEILNNVDPSVDPCTDFYQFACGNFISNTSLDYAPYRSSRTSVEDEMNMRMRSILEKPIAPENPRYLITAKRFFKSCMNVTARNRNGLSKMKGIFKQMGGWPLQEGYWSQGRFKSWMAATHELRKMGINFRLFFDVSVEQHPSHMDKYVIVLDSPSFTISEAENTPIAYMIELAIEMGADKSRVERDQKDVKEMLLNIAKIIEATVKVTDTQQTMPIKDLRKIRYMDWLKYLSGVLGPGVNITENDEVVVTHPSYLGSIVGLLDRTQMRTVANFMAWYTLQYELEHLPTRIQDRLYHHIQRVFDNIPKKALWQTCLKSTKERFSLALAAAFLQENYDEERRHGMIDLIKNLKHHFKDRLQKIEWLDNHTKNTAREMSSTSLYEIVTAEEISQVIEREGIYNNIEIDEDKYLETVLGIDLLYTNLKYGKLKRPVRNTRWSCQRFPTGFDVDYSPRENIFRIPAGLLHELYFAKDRPNYMNYGSFGTLMAHEISHILIAAEDRSHQGNLRDWWTPQSLQRYDDHARCLSKQYAKFSEPGFDRTVNSTRRQDEDMADFSGVLIAYQAYLDWIYENGKEQHLPGINYTPNQLFWISSAIRQCAKRTRYSLQQIMRSGSETPEKLRVNGVLSNLDYFAYDFGCPLGSRMNPRDKCDVW